MLFLYGEVLGVELPWLDGISRPRQVKRLPMVLSADEVKRIFRFMEGEHLLMAKFNCQRIRAAALSGGIMLTKRHPSAPSVGGGGVRSPLDAL